MSKFKVEKQHKKTARSERVRKVARVARHPAVTIPLATFSAMLTLTVLGIIIFSGGDPKLGSRDTRTAIISHDGQETTVPTRAANVGQLLENLNIKINDGDVVEPGLKATVSTDNFRINVYRAAPVTIVDGEDKTFTFSAAATPRSIVKQVGIEVYPEDRLESIPTENFLLEGSIGPRVVISRATPVNVNLYGTQVMMRTHSKTVGELLEERDIILEKGETVRPKQETLVDKNMQIFILQEGAELAMEEQEIAMPVEEVEDNSLSFGTRAVRQEGQPGKRIVTFIIEKDAAGKEIGRKQIQSIVVQEAVKQIVAIGTFFDISADRTSVMAAAGIAMSDYAYVDYIVSHESGWRPFARNASSGAFGLCQALPGSKMASSGSDWETNPVTQLRWCSGYAASRYGSWANAYQTHVSQGWW
jgi:resuscitation-promoting factor RpfB